uniref:Uncharacterized protein n=1 Tax=Anguilla anguilla TaxID=7936 RepID=A0A0E9PE46_ANGAN
MCTKPPVLQLYSRFSDIPNNRCQVSQGSELAKL